MRGATFLSIPMMTCQVADRKAASSLARSPQYRPILGLCSLLSFTTANPSCSTHSSNLKSVRRSQFSSAIRNSSSTSSTQIVGSGSAPALSSFPTTSCLNSPLHNDFGCCELPTFRSTTTILHAQTLPSGASCFALIPNWCCSLPLNSRWHLNWWVLPAFCTASIPTQSSVYNHNRSL